MKTTALAAPAVGERFLRVLVVEDNPADAELQVRELERAGLEARAEVVSTAGEFAERLRRSEYDVVLADYRLPGCTGLEVLAEIGRQGKDIPCILVTGSLGEETAVECIKAGVADYVLKDRLVRLPVAVRRALEEKGLREGRRRAEEALRATNEKLRALIQASPVAILVTDRVGGVQLWNAAAERIFGWPAAEAIGQLLPFVPPEKQEESRALRERVLRGESFADVELERRRKDGALVHVSLSAAPLHDAAGVVVGMVGVAADISERKRAEEALRRSEEKFAKSFHRAPVAISLTTLAEGRYLDVNQTFLQMTGYAREEVIGRTVFDLKVWAQPEQRAHLVERLRQSGAVASLEVEFRVRSGEARVGLLSAEIIELDGQACLLSLVRDITERKRAEEQLRELSGRLLQVQDEERRRLARDLHDTTAQSLAALVLTLSHLEDTVGAESVLGPGLGSCLALAEQSAREIRTFSYLLHPPLLEELGLMSALRSYAEGFTQRSGIRVELEMPPVEVRLPAEMELSLFRVAQESLANVHRHSGSPRARLRLAVEAGEARLEVSDQGRGLAPQVLARFEHGGAELGVGLAGMRERLRQLGGRLEVLCGAPGCEGPGTTVRARLPLPGIAPGH